MRLPWLVIALITAWGLFSLVRILFGDLGEFNDLFWLLVGVLLAASLGFIVFQFRVWDQHTRAVFHIRAPALHPGPSALDVTFNSIWSFTCILGVIITIIVTVLEYNGRHDLVVAGAQWLADRMMRLLNALLH